MIESSDISINFNSVDDSNINLPDNHNRPYLWRLSNKGDHIKNPVGNYHYLLRPDEESISLYEICDSFLDMHKNIDENPNFIESCAFTYVMFTDYYQDKKRKNYTKKVVRLNINKLKAFENSNPVFKEKLSYLKISKYQKQSNLGVANHWEMGFASYEICNDPDMQSVLQNCSDHIPPYKEQNNNFFSKIYKYKYKQTNSISNN